jgi:hypothetical protein
MTECVIGEDLVGWIGDTGWVRDGSGGCKTDIERCGCEEPNRACWEKWFVRAGVEMEIMYECLACMDTTC